jgi:hypothetical protein
MTSVLTDLQYIVSANDSSKSALDDFGQKWKHTAAQFELNRKFVSTHNPDDEIMTTGPDIYDNYKSQVDAYGERSVYNRDSGQLVPQMAATSVPVRPQGCGPWKW